MNSPLCVGYSVCVDVGVGVVSDGIDGSADDGGDISLVGVFIIFGIVLVLSVLVEVMVVSMVMEVVMANY